MKPTDMHTGLTAERVRELLSYDQETGVMRWRVARRSVAAGRVAGYKERDGYLRVKVEARLYPVHRLAWLHFYGEWPVDQIDHINGVKDDNRMENLRDVSQQVNKQNMRKAVRKAILSPFHTGLLGASFSLRRQLFISYIRDPVAMKTKYLGSFVTAEEAHQAYIKAKRLMHEGNTL